MVEGGGSGGGIYYGVLVVGSGVIEAGDASASTSVRKRTIRAIRSGGFGGCGGVHGDHGCGSCGCG